MSSQTWHRPSTSSSSSYDSISAALLGATHSRGGKNIKNTTSTSSIPSTAPPNRGKTTFKSTTGFKSSKAAATWPHPLYKDESDADDDFDGFSDDDDEDDDGDPSYGPGGKPIVHKPARRNGASSSSNSVKTGKNKGKGKAKGRGRGKSSQSLNKSHSMRTGTSTSTSTSQRKTKTKANSIGKGKSKVTSQKPRNLTSSSAHRNASAKPPRASKAKAKSAPSVPALNDDDSDSSSISSVASMDTPSEISNDSDEHTARGAHARSHYDQNSSEDNRMHASSSSDDDSDDSVYEAVDDVSDGEDELDMSVEQLEEQEIIQTEHFEFPASSSHLSDFSARDDAQDYGWGAAAGEKHVHFQTAYNARNNFGNNGNDDDGNNDAFNMAHANANMHDSSSDSDITFSDEEDEDEDDLMSDFLQQDALDPDLRKIIESDADALYGQRRPEFVVSHEIYDFPRNIYHTESDSSYRSDSSDYDIESDGGETTDEDYPPPATITHPRSLLRRDSSASLSPSNSLDEANSTSAANTHASSRPFRRRGPLRGTFVADPHKPVAVIAPNGTSLILIPPYASSRHDWLETAAGSLVGTAVNSPTMHSAGATPGVGMNLGMAMGMGVGMDVGGMKGLFEVDDESDNAVTSPTGGIVPAPHDAGAVAVNGNGNGNERHPVTFRSFNFMGDGSLDGDEEMEDCDDDSEALLNVDDFIDFGDSSSDEDDGTSRAHPTLAFDGEEKEDFYDSDAFATPAAAQKSATAPATINESTPSRPSNATTATISTTDGTSDNKNGNSNNNNGESYPVISDAERLLNRLDGGVVTAFRQNHNRYHALIRLPPHKEFMPANSPSRSAGNVSSVFRRTKYSERPSRSSRRPRVPSSYMPSPAGMGMPMNMELERKRTATSAGYSGSEAVRRKILDSSSSRRGSAVLGAGNNSLPSTPVTPAPSVRTH